MHLMLIYRFNPRPHAGGDARPAHTAPDNQSFNPRPHAGGDRLLRAAYGLLYRFNPRPHAGGDSTAFQSRRLAVFQSTPPRGGRQPHVAFR